MSEEINKTENEISKQNVKNKYLQILGRAFSFIGITLLMIVICLYFVMLVCAKGPSERVKEIFVLSVKESSAGGFLANIYLSGEEIEEIQKANTVEETEEVTDVSIVSVNAAEQFEAAADNEQETVANIVDTPYDSEVYTEDGMEFHLIEGGTFTGTMVIVPDPSRVFVGTPRDVYDGQPGTNVPAICERYGAILGVNGGFFVDTGGVGNGGTPIGFVFSEGQMKYGGLSEVNNMMGFNDEGVLICGKMSGQDAVNYGIRDGISCNPFLVINGEKMNVNGTGGGLNPRTAVGQRADGAVLLLVIDGRQATSLGASMSDVADVMLSFGAVNAGNLDGGGSTVLYYNGEIKNVVMSIYGARGIPDAVCVRPLQQ